MILAFLDLSSTAFNKVDAIRDLKTIVFEENSSHKTNESQNNSLNKLNEGNLKVNWIPFN